MEWSQVVNPESNLVEVVEIPDHPWFVGTQFHPEYKSTVEKPHPLFIAFLRASLEKKTAKLIATDLAEN